MILPRAVAVLALIQPMPVFAHGPCNFANDWCVPFIGCLETQSEIFTGHAHGREAGPLEAITSTGAQCTGDWRQLSPDGGIALFSCDDTRSGSVQYTYVEPETGTAVGTGQTRDGQSLRFWSGPNLSAFFRETTDGATVSRACGTETIPLN